jgi:hypothetical protein
VGELERHDRNITTLFARVDAIERRLRRRPRGRRLPRRVNINGYVTVRLTEAGAKTYRKFLAVSGSDGHRIAAGLPPVVVRAGEPVGFQLWELMRVFGPALYMGCKGLFEGGEVEFGGWGQ